MVTTRAGTPTNSPGSARPSSGAARQPKRQRRTRTRLRLDNDAGGTDEVEVSSSVAVTAAGAGDPDDDPGDDADSDGGDTEDASWNQNAGEYHGGRDSTSPDGATGGGDDQDDDDQGGRRRPDHRRPTTRRPARPSLSNEQGGRHEHAESSQEDTLESMTWWDALTPTQQRAMMRRPRR
jgi:hypothetical protein